mmetsp:Transcript_3008/g.7932  ORF Transcript_3008/g.7932 Transcript_3008/m.7932 type:complete len:181 (-) Transcript_3008:51-593(-)
MEPRPEEIQFCNARSGSKQAHARAAVIDRLLPSLERVSLQLAELLAADWLRVDAFIHESGKYFINELSYPSHRKFHTKDCSVHILARAYAALPASFEFVEPAPVLARVLDLIGVDVGQFMISRDYLHPRMFHAPEAEYAHRTTLNSTRRVFYKLGYIPPERLQELQVQGIAGGEKKGDSF